MSLDFLLNCRLESGHERGATAVEYSIIAALVAAVIIIVVAFLGADTRELFERVDF